MQGKKLSKEARIAAVKEEWMAEVNKMPSLSADTWPNNSANKPYWDLEKKYKAIIKGIIEE